MNTIEDLRSSSQLTSATIVEVKQLKCSFLTGFTPCEGSSLSEDQKQKLYNKNVVLLKPKGYAVKAFIVTVGNTLQSKIFSSLSQAIEALSI